jgi:hypothetical protein
LLASRWWRLPVAHTKKMSRGGYEMQRRHDQQESDVRRATWLSLTSPATSAETQMEASGAAREEP